jgi:elongation factor 1-beta
LFVSLKKAVAPKPAAAAAEEDEFDPFGSDDDEPSEETQKRLDEYNDKKAKSKGFCLPHSDKTSPDTFLVVEERVTAQSIIVLDIKAWDDETDLQEMEKSVRSIEKEGLVWGQCM